MLKARSASGNFTTIERASSRYGHVVPSPSASAVGACSSGLPVSSASQHGAVQSASRLALRCAPASVSSAASAGSPSTNCHCLSLLQAKKGLIHFSYFLFTMLITLALRFAARASTPTRMAGAPIALASLRNVSSHLFRRRPKLSSLLMPSTIAVDLSLRNCMELTVNHYLHHSLAKTRMPVRRRITLFRVRLALTRHLRLLERMPRPTMTAVGSTVQLESVRQMNRIRQPCHHPILQPQRLCHVQWLLTIATLTQQHPPISSRIRVYSTLTTVLSSSQGALRRP